MLDEEPAGRVVVLLIFPGFGKDCSPVRCTSDSCWVSREGLHDKEHGGCVQTVFSFVMLSSPLFRSNPTWFVMLWLPFCCGGGCRRCRPKRVETGRICFAYVRVRQFHWLVGTPFRQTFSRLFKFLRSIVCTPGRSRHGGRIRSSYMKRPGW